MFAESGSYQFLHLVGVRLETLNYTTNRIGDVFNDFGVVIEKDVFKVGNYIFNEMKVFDRNGSTAVCRNFCSNSLCWDGKKV